MGRADPGQRADPAERLDADALRSPEPVTMPSRGASTPTREQARGPMPARTGESLPGGAPDADRHAAETEGPPQRLMADGQAWRGLGPIATTLLQGGVRIG
jgi:hypothetical protein